MTDPMTTTQTKAEFLTEALIETVNNEWKVNALENNVNHYSMLSMEVGRKYIKVWQQNVWDGVVRESRSCFMFVDKNDGAVYKPASYKAPAKGIRFSIEGLNENPHIIDQFGSFLYRR